MARLFDRVRAPSTSGTFLPWSTFDHVRRLDAVAARLRKGSTDSVRGAASLLALAPATARRTGAIGTLSLCQPDHVLAIMRV